VLSDLRPPEVSRREAAVRVQESHDFDLLQRCWTGNDHPVRRCRWLMSIFREPAMGWPKRFH
jgi:hypothetical protein